MKYLRNIIGTSIALSFSLLASAQNGQIPAEFRGMWSSNKSACAELLKSGDMPESPSISITQKDLRFGGISSCEVTKKSKIAKGQLSGEFKCASEGEENIGKLSLTLINSDQIANKEEDGKTVNYYRCKK